MSRIAELKESRAKIEEYCEFLRKRGRKESSIYTVTKALRGAIKRLTDEGLEITPERIGRDEVLAILRSDLAPATKRSYVTILSRWMRHFGNFAINDMGLMWNDDASPNVKWIDEAEFKIALMSVKDPTEEMILLLGARCGLRRHEISQLRVSDIKGSQMIIHGKGHGVDGKIRIIPLSSKMVEKIKAYKAYREREKIGMRVRVGDYFLFNTSKYELFPVTDDRVNYIVHDISTRTGIDFTPHSLRRLFATTAASVTDIHIVQTLMGHSSIATTERYIRRDRSAMLDAMEMVSAKI